MGIKYSYPFEAEVSQSHSHPRSTQQALPIQIQQLNDGFRRLFLLSLAVLLLEALFFLNTLNPQALLGWSILLLISERAFKGAQSRVRSEVSQVNQLLYYEISAVILGILSGIAPFWFFPIISVQQLFIIPLGITVLCAAAAMLLVSHYRAVVLYTLFSCLPLASFSYAMTESLDIRWGGAWLGAITAILIIAQGHSRSIRELLQNGSARADRPELHSELCAAIQSDELEVFYQPKLTLADNQIASVEALLRWRHPDRGLVQPSTFIPMAEQHELIEPLGQLVLNQACQQAAQWKMAGTPVQVAVNVSACQLRQKDFPEKVASALFEAGLEARYLQLEITESLLMAKPEECIRSLNAIRQLGVTVSMDDFGTGYSSLSYLKDLPLDILKIDRSFIMDLASNSEGQSITRAIITMAHSLGLKVVAEGVESREALLWLKQNHCDEAQGIHISEVLSADELTALLKKFDTHH